MLTPSTPFNGWNFPVIQRFISEVLDSRRTHRELEQAIVEHEAEALVTGEASTPGPSKGRRSSKRKSGGVRKPVQSSKLSDLQVRPPNARSVPSNVPRQVSNLLAWDVVKLRSTVNTSTTALTENNFSMALSQHPQASSWSVLFDQWCIPMFSLTIYSTQAPGASGTIPELHTALDFDNTTNLNSLATIDDFSTAQVDTLVLNKSVTRSIRPCMKPFVNGSLNALDRMWCDSNTSAVPWFGLRSIISQTTAAVPIVFEQTAWFAFRNQI